LDEFTEAVCQVVKDSKHDVGLMCQGMNRLVNTRQEEYDETISPAFVNEFLDECLLNRLGSNVLMKGYLSCVNDANAANTADREGMTVDPYCDVAVIFQTTAWDMMKLCQ
jgi:hypothetical protein